jgi:amidase
MQRIGCSVEPIPLGFAPQRVWSAWLVWRHWLVTGRLAPYLPDPARRAMLKPEAQWEAEGGLRLSAADVFAASAERSAFYAHLLTLFERFDCLVLPSAQTWPFDAALHWPAQVNGRAMDTYHRWMEVVIYATLAGLPTLSVPVGFDAGGLPMGMQLMGRPQADRAVLELGAAYETAIPDWLARDPGASRASTDARETRAVPIQFAAKQ